MDVYEKGLKEQIAGYKRQTTRQKYAKSEHYREFKQAVYVWDARANPLMLFTDACHLVGGTTS